MIWFIAVGFLAIAVGRHYNEGWLVLWGEIHVALMLVATAVLAALYRFLSGVREEGGEAE